jgi:hypothetical protein
VEEKGEVWRRILLDERRMEGESEAGIRIQMGMKK